MWQHWGNPTGQREPAWAPLNLSDAIDVVAAMGHGGKSLSPEGMELDLSSDHSHVLALRNQLQVWVNRAVAPTVHGRNGLKADGRQMSRCAITGCERSQQN